MSKSNKQRFGLFYRSNGRWAGPYGGVTFTRYMLNRQPLVGELKFIKNNVLKSRVQIRPVKATA